MSFEVTTAFVEQYSRNIILLHQQKESKLRAAVRVEPGIVGKNAFFDQVSQTAAVKRTSRHADTPLVSTPHLRRRVTLADYDWADLIDDLDKVKMLADPTSVYIQNAVAAFNRSIDDAIIEAALATAYGGVDGSTSYAFDTSNFQIVNGSAGMTLAKLLSAKQKLDAQEIPEEDRFLALGSKQLQDLLNVSEVKSADYNTVRALVRGEIDTYLGFKFIRSERLSSASSVRKCLAWHKDSILLGIGQDIKTRVTERADKNYAIQPYASMSIGAVRMDQIGVVEIDCLES